MFVPLSDDEDNPIQIVPWVCYGILTLNVLVYLYSVLVDYIATDANFLIVRFTPREYFIYNWGTIPQKIFSSEFSRFWPTLFSSMFMHASFFHILGNLWFFRILADNIEDRLGHLKFLGFYLLAGLAGVLGHSLLHVDSPIPYVGASGAIAGVMGAYVALYPETKVLVYFCPVWFWVKRIKVPSWSLILTYAAFDVIHGVGTLGSSGAGVAYFAHIGGFFSGLALAWPLRERNMEYAILNTEEGSLNKAEDGFGG